MKKLLLWILRRALLELLKGLVKILTGNPGKENGSD